MENKMVSNLKRKREDEDEDPHQFSIEKHAICCEQIIMEGSKQPSLLKNHLNFIQSGPPQRILLHTENGDWDDFAHEGFTAKDTVLFEVEFGGNPCLVDFLHMTLFHLNSGSQQPIGWMNKAGKCFFPVNFNLHDCFRYQGNLIKRDDEILAAVANKDFMGGSKPLRLLPQTLHRILSKDEKQHFLLNKDNIVGMKGFTDARAQARLKRFEEQVGIVERVRGRGYANVRYAWLGASKAAVCRIFRNGIVFNDLPKAAPAYGNGVHLASASCSDISASYCDIDENGLQYMVLCRVILGNMELVHPGTKQFSPSGKNCDSGVDDLINPKRYIIWNKNMNTHIYPEYAVSFKSPSIAEGHPSESRSKDAASLGKNLTACQKKPRPNASHINSRGNCQQTPVPVGISQQKDLTTKFDGPMFPMSMLLTEMEDKVPYNVMKILYQLYDQHKKKKMSKDQLFQMMRLVVGGTLLRDSLISLRPKLS